MTAMPTPTKDIRWSPAPAADERAYWCGLMDGVEPERLSLAVLRRLRPPNDGPLLAIDQDLQDAIDTFLRKMASARLSRMPMCRQTFDRVWGHPVDLARLAFELRDDPLPAAAMYALSHDGLFPVRHQNTAEYPSVRFALARCLMRLPMPEGEADAPTAMAHAAVEYLEAVADDDRAPVDLRASIRSWLNAQD